MIKDLSELKNLAAKKEKENWEFRSWLKFHAPSNIDAIARELSRKYSSLIDCKECANCCRSLEIVLDKEDLKAMARSQGASVTDFLEKWTFVSEQSERTLRPPCPMLKEKLCTVYGERPETCRTYPHLEKPHVLSRLIGVIGSLAICPIAYNVFEELKQRLKWRPGQGTR
jgi:Fe-S-cluster containining protein